MNTILSDRTPFVRGRELATETRFAAAESLVTQPIDGVPRLVSLPVTFTPFASARPCSARCVFCSETLWHRDATVLSASLRPSGTYFEGLRRTLAQLRGLPVGISLSGLEATDDPDWLCQTLDALQEHEAHPEGRVEEKVLYSNTAGLARETHGAVLLPRLARYGLTRIEISRHHHTAEGNDAIMRFRPGQPIRAQDVFERTVRDVAQVLPVRLVCVVQAPGVGSLDEVQSYLAWAWQTLGVRDVVFREFSRLGDLYRPNATLRIVERDRVSIEALLEQVWPEGRPPHPDYVPQNYVVGYYYWNARFTWQDAVQVTFETSDYATMKARHRSDVIYKLIYHANGHLCADWDPLRQVLYRSL